MGLALVPWILTAGRELSVRVTAQVAVEQTERHPVSARVLQAPRSDPDGLREVTPVAWTALDGTERVAGARVPVSSEVGDVVRLWVDRDGTVSGHRWTPRNR